MIRISQSQCGGGVRLKITDLFDSRWERPYAPGCDNLEESNLDVKLPESGEGRVLLLHQICVFAASQQTN